MVSLMRKYVLDSSQPTEGQLFFLKPGLHYAALAAADKEASSLLVKQPSVMTICSQLGDKQPLSSAALPAR